MRQREVTLSRPDVKVLQRNVGRLGGYAADLVRTMDLGLDEKAFLGHLQRTEEHLATLALDEALSLSLRPQDASYGSLVDPMDLPWNYPQTLRFASGACLISQKYHRWMSPDNLRRALVAKVLYKCQTGILDDLVDKGDYNYLEAKDLYHLVLSSMTDPSLEPQTFMKRLMATLRQDQVQHFDLILAIANNFNLLFTLSPHGADLFYQMEALDEHVALGQALTMFQKEAHLDLGQVANISRGFSTVDEGLRWHERLATYVSGGTRYNLIDISFLDRTMRSPLLEAVWHTWSYFDAAIVFLNNVVHVYEDLRNGIANLSLVAMREKEVLPLTTLEGYDPALTEEDYEAHLTRMAALAGKGLEHVSAHFPDPTQYYPFIAVMMPVVMLADWIGQHDELLTLYLEALAPSLRRAAVEGPRQEARVFPRVPQSPRARR